MVAAFDFAVEVSAGERHAAMGAGVAQGEGLALPVAADDQRKFQQHGFVELVAVNLIGRQGAIPEAEEHERIGSLALREVEIGHGRILIESLC